MTRFSRTALERDGIDGFLQAAKLPDPRRRRPIPQTNGVYVVYVGSEPPPFELVSPAGWWNGRDPSLPIRSLTERWVPGASVIYIGLATV